MSDGSRFFHYTMFVSDLFEYTKATKVFKNLLKLSRFMKIHLDGIICLECKYELVNIQSNYDMKSKQDIYKSWVFVLNSNLGRS